MEGLIDGKPRRSDAGSDLADCMANPDAEQPGIGGISGHRQVDGDGWNRSGIEGAAGRGQPPRGRCVQQACFRPPEMAGFWAGEAGDRNGNWKGGGKVPEADST